MAYDVEGARKAGYTEDQIADDMADAAGIDPAAARKSGYTTEILMKELLALPAAATEPPPGARGEQAEKWGVPQGGPAASPTSPAVARDASPGFDPNAPNRVIGAAAEGWERGSHPLTPEAEKAVDESGALGRFVYNPLLRAVTGVPSAILRGGQQLVQETVGGVTGSPGLGRDVAAAPEVFPTGLGGMRPAVPHAPEAAPAPAPGRFVHEVYGEPNPFAQQYGPPPPPATPGFVPPGTAPPPGGTLPRILEIIREDERIGANRPAMIPPEAPQPPTNAFAPQPPPRAAAPPPPPPGAPPGAPPPPPGGAPPPPGGPGTPNAFAPPRTPTTAAEAKAIANTWYKQHEAAGGARLPPEFANEFIETIKRTAPQTPEGLAIGGETEITKLISRSEALRDRPISLQAAQEIDEALSNLIDQQYKPTGLTKEGKQLLDLQADFREGLMNAAPAGDAGAVGGLEALKNGRKAWAQSRKMEDLERIQNRAKIQDHPDTGIRAQIRALLDNRRRSRGYSAEERAALESAAKRGLVGGALHVFGSRLGPLIVGGSSLATGNIPGAIMAAGGAHLATSALRAGATKLANRRVRRTLGKLGSSVPMPNAFAPPP